MTDLPIDMYAAPVSSRTEQAEQTRQQIIETAQQLFAEQGYDATSLQMIADELNLTKAAVYYHFHAKGDILHAVMQPSIARVEGLLDQATLIRGRRARVEFMLDGFVDFLVGNRQYAVMASTDPAMKRHKSDAEMRLTRQRGLELMFGAKPTGADRLAFHLVFSIPDGLSELVDLTDAQLRDALRTTLHRLLRL